MNHSLHWRESPAFISRPGDTRLERVYVFRLKDPRKTEKVWTVIVQQRNCVTVNWRTFEVFHYDLWEQALAFVRLLRVFV